MTLALLLINITSYLLCLVNILLLQFFELIHIDLWVPYRTKASTGASYFPIILDDYNKKTWSDLLSNKEQVEGVLCEFLCSCRISVILR